eukprot:TRINITY_DN27390_c0_g1_i1.p1 TRINITY_DN27390_c0_g1~~TRINITY_DN27390_c0_g1_i1.p1  ORF type:complete len:100 (-),score=2.17 TRINITY_DN27390_c0_g1_i1:90-389(-)
MDIFQVIFTVVNIQGVLSCFPWTFPEDITGVCCRRREIGNEVYLFVEISEQDWQHFECASPCVYYKQGDQDPSNTYCFKYGRERNPYVFQWNLTMQCSD